MNRTTNLILLRDNLPIGAFFLDPEKKTTIGRAASNTVVLQDDRCSRLHAEIEYKNNQWFLTDCKSRNGTAINNRLVSGRNELKNGDRIQIGHAILFFSETNIPNPESDTSDDYESARAVSETLAVAMNCFHEQKELTAHLNRVRSENQMLQSLLNKESEIIGNSPVMQEVGRLILVAARSKATVLIRGESGVGKELVARAIHFNSDRSRMPMTCLNCAALSESLLASELFGHEKGAFTGATEKKIGKFEASNGGTLFLDEIAEMSPPLQAKFLRVLEGQPFERVGGNKPISVDVRVIAATNRDLEKDVAEGRFRHDLFFRLHVLEITVPPLRKRGDDIIMLARFFLDKFSQETKRRFQDFDYDTERILQSYRWPGNVRELKNVVERAVLLGQPPLIEPDDLLLSSLKTTGKTKEMERPATSISQQENRERSTKKINGQKTGDTDTRSKTEKFVPMTLEQIEANYIQKTLDHFQWNKSQTAKSLGIERATLDRKIARYQITRSQTYDT